MLELGARFRHDDLLLGQREESPRRLFARFMMSMNEGLTVQAWVLKLGAGFRHDDLLLGQREEHPRHLFARFTVCV